MKNLKKLSRNELRKLTGGEGSLVCGMTCSSGKVISMHHCDSCAPMSGGAGMGCGVKSNGIGTSTDLGRGPLEMTMYVQEC
ncbi:hypothetical protein JET18_20200 [Chryseobacterium sp. L7]|uniref:Bacteriocin n=1 Tax=Chryseobacterium endalhagicum TaxID=2797638 RepID=A0ABS1QKM2_9FLAO|nr:hypothetical protein [Chryseobacterium endalhagicum]MBL1223178.1 hypothetical protein [Chryseobacterium endalhagicum]